MSDRLTQVDINAIRARCHATTAPPWHVVCIARHDYALMDGPSYDSRDLLSAESTKTKGCPGVGKTAAAANARFCAYARTDVPRLLAEIDCLRRELAEARTLLRRVADEADYYAVTHHPASEWVSGDVETITLPPPLYHAVVRAIKALESEGINNGVSP